MNNGFSLEQAIKLLDNDYNHQCFIYLKDKMDQGENIKDVFVHVLNKNYANYFQSFINFLPLSTSLDLTYKIIGQLKQTQKEISKQCLYPCLMFVATIAGVFVFSKYFFPSLINMMLSFKTDPSLMMLVQKGSLIGSTILMSMMVLVSLLALYFGSTKHKVKGYQLVYKHSKNSLIVNYVNYLYAQCLIECLYIGEGTKASIDILRNMHLQPIISYLANRMSNKLNEGDSYESTLESVELDRHLYQFMIIGINGGNMIDMLETYLYTNKQLFKTRLKRITKTIQLSSYGIIGVVLIFVYQILLLPLQVISQM